MSDHFLTKKDTFSFFNEIVINSWWVILFLFILLFAFDRASFQRAKTFKWLDEKKCALLEAQSQALAERQHLQSQLESRHDPAFLEMVLMRRLGLVAEGQTKVVFERP